jgi:hypothetical protein
MEKKIIKIGPQRPQVRFKRLEIENTVVLNSGTATIRRLYADKYPSYTQLIVKDKTLLVNLIKTETG